MRKGCLVYDEGSGRMDIRFGLEVVCCPHQMGFLREYPGSRVGYKTIGMELLEPALGKEGW